MPQSRSHKNQIRETSVLTDMVNLGDGFVSTVKSGTKAVGKIISGKPLKQVDEEFTGEMTETGKRINERADKDRSK